jgi:PadR family transcriptional regulator, regulatory protein PadR
MAFSQHGLAVLRIMLQDRKQAVSGTEILKMTGIGSGTLYPMLKRFEASGWVSSTWENADPHRIGRPRRRLYKLTAMGTEQAAKVLSSLQMRSGPL